MKTWATMSGWHLRLTRALGPQGIIFDILDEQFIPVQLGTITGKEYGANPLLILTCHQ